MAAMLLLSFSRLPHFSESASVAHSSYACASTTLHRGQEEGKRRRRRRRRIRIRKRFCHNRTNVKSQYLDEVLGPGLTGYEAALPGFSAETET
jgi:hypothetical protein